MDVPDACMTGYRESTQSHANKTLRNRKLKLMNYDTGEGDYTL